MSGEMQRSIPQGLIAGSDNLFSRVGIELVLMTLPGGFPEAFVRARHFPGRSFSPTVYENLAFAKKKRPANDAKSGLRQLFLPLSVGQAAILMVPPTSIASMNASIRSIFRSTRKLQNAAKHLMQSDILYLGDLTQLSPPELRACLGRYRDLQFEMQTELRRWGLELGALAPWWVRPCDYYQHNL